MLILQKGELSAHRLKSHVRSAAQIMKKIISFILCIAMLVSTAAFVYADEPSSWAKEEVEAGIAAGLVPEELQKNYTSPVTRGQVAGMFINLLEKASGKPVEEIISEKGKSIDENAFTDTSDRNVLSANALGIINGTGKGKFSPDGTLKRAQIAAIINRVATVMGIETAGYTHDFTDITANYSWADSELGWPVEAGIIKGVGGTKFNPGGDLTTEQSILITARALTALTRNVISVYVSPEGSSAADGTRNAPFGTIDEAKAYLRNIDKSEYTETDIVLLPGTHVISNPINFTESDSGTESCPLRITAEEGALLVGGIALGASDFVKASGGLTEYFPAEARDKIVMVDLKNHGFTAEMIEKAQAGGVYHANIPFLSVDGHRQTLAQFPNNDWIQVKEGMAIDYDGTEMPKLTSSSSPEYYRIRYGEEYFPTVSSWSGTEKIYVRARWNHLWCPDDALVLEISKDTDLMRVSFAGGYEVKEESVCYWYNVPEELDIPGEYIIGRDAVLYYYPADDFEDAVMTLPLTKDVFVFAGTDNVIIDGLDISSYNGYAIKASDVDNFTVSGSTIHSGYTGIVISGSNHDIDIMGNFIYDMGSRGMDIDAGDFETLTPGNLHIYNNYVYNWSVTDGYGYAITASGVNVLIDHNVCNFGNFKGIHIGHGFNAAIEYNEVSEACRLTDDVGIISGDGGKENANVVVRYNYVHDCGPVGTPDKMDHYGAMAFYYDGASSYFKTYGNVVRGMNGSGCLLNAGRCNEFTGNLVIDCSRWYVHLSDFGFKSNFDDNGQYKDRHYTLPDYVYLDEFKAVNPEPSQLILDPLGVDPSNPMVCEAPAFNVAKDNWCHFNKYGRSSSFVNYGVAPYYIEEYVYLFVRSVDDIDVPEGSRTNDHVSVYNSKRESVDLKQLITETAAGVISIDWDTFTQIGIVDADWTIDTDINTEMTQYR